MKLYILIFILSIGISIGRTEYLHAATIINLGSNEDFAILANSTITNIGFSVINGNLGLSPGTSVSGFPPGIVNGTQHVSDSSAIQAQIDLTSAYISVTAQAPVSTIPTELGGTTLTTGRFNSTLGTFGITGTLTLDAQGDPDAFFIFKTNATLITASSSSIVLINGAQACNIFWQVGSSATLGANSVFKGNMLVQTSATLGIEANVEGRVLVRDAAVTLNTNTITLATCLPPITDPITPLINILKIPSPLVLPSGPGSVTYNYSVSNIGTEAMSNVTVTDDKCSPINHISGDINSNLILEVTETWTYECSATLLLTTTNIATATGDANGLTATDTASVTVVVGAVLPPPLIHLIKVPNVFISPYNGIVTYTYIISNPGVAALEDVSLVDDKCSSISQISGDINTNNILEITEEWIYKCSMNLISTTTNTAIAGGSANNLTAVDSAFVTVIVAAQSIIIELPNTGGSIYNQIIPWNNIIVALAIISSISIIYKPISKIRIKINL